MSGEPIALNKFPVCCYPVGKCKGLRHVYGGSFAWGGIINPSPGGDSRFDPNGRHYGGS